MVTARLDGKGRLSIPNTIREDLGIEPGDVMYLDVRDSVLRIAKATNPFDALIEEAVEDLEAGRTVNIRDFARAEGLSIEWPADNIE